MKLAIVACDVLKPEIEFLTKDDPDFVHREYLEFALHEYGDVLKAKVLEAVNALEGKVDAVLIGYAVCQALEGITKMVKVPAVSLPGADCIDALLTTPEYVREKEICAGTWFVSPGWAEAGVAGLMKEFHMDECPDIDMDIVMGMLFGSYERCLFIDTGIGMTDYYREKSEKVAEELGLRHDCRTCNVNAIRDAIAKLKDLARSLE